MKNIIKYIPLILLTTLSISTLFIGSEISTSIIVTSLAGLTGFVYFLNTKETPDIRKELALELNSIRQDVVQVKDDIGQMHLVSKRVSNGEKIRF